MTERSIAAAARAALQTLVDHAHDTEYQDLVTAVTEITNAAIDRMDVELTTIKAIADTQDKQIELLGQTVRAQVVHIGKLETAILVQAKETEETRRRITVLEGIASKLLALLPEASR